MKVFSSAVLGILASIPIAGANAMTGNDLAEICGTSRISAEPICVTYITGVLHEAWWGQALAAANRRTSTADMRTYFVYCPPKDVPAKQMVEVIKKYIRDNPARLHKDAGLVIVQAAIEAFPTEEHCNTAPK